jgi:hypothetical protein
MEDFYQQVALELSDANLPDQGLLRLKVTSQSMVPLLRPGDYVLVKSTSAEFILRGDLIVTRRADSRGWLTKGDQNRQVDAPVGEREIIGLVVAFERYGKLHSLRTRIRILVARWLGCLGWLEAGRFSPIGRWAARTTSRSLRYIFR